jgi:dynein heavy chain
VGPGLLNAVLSLVSQVRERIETSGRDARWEFNKATLFSCSNYMAEVCGNLMEMVEVVDDFFKFLGPELKAVTGAWCSMPWQPSLKQCNCTSACEASF